MHQVCLIQSHPTHQMGEAFTFWTICITTNKLNSACLKQVKENKHNFHPSLLERVSAVQLDKKYGNLSDKKGILAAPFRIYTLLFKKNKLLFLLFNGWAVLSYITLYSSLHKYGRTFMEKVGGG